MHMVDAHRPLNYLYPLVVAQPLDDEHQLLPDFSVQDFPPILRDEYDMIRTIPLRMGLALIWHSSPPVAVLVHWYAPLHYHRRFSV